MKLYAPRSTSVTAVRFLPDGSNGLTIAKQPHISAEIDGTLRVVERDTGNIYFARPGEWIVESPDGSMDVMSDAWFRAQFTEAP